MQIRAHRILIRKVWLPQNVAGGLGTGQLRIDPFVLDIFHHFGDFGTILLVVLKYFAECPQEPRREFFEIIRNLGGLSFLILFECTILGIVHPVCLAPGRIAREQGVNHDAELPGVAGKAADEFLIFDGLDDLWWQEILPCVLDAVDKDTALGGMAEITELDACEIQCEN